ncbi:MAG: O-antigen ligase family protein [Bacteroidales bacterium]|jgi:hypothetical protein|nr:O-antigen ligase family protein [Bacteroidales bacterium]
MIRLSSILPESNNKARWLHLTTTLLFLALFAFPLFPFAVTNLILILVFFLTLIIYFIRPVPIGKKLLLNSIYIIPFIPYLLEFFISGFDPVAGFELEKKLFFFTAPLVLPLFLEVTKFSNYKLPMMIFSFSMTALAIYSVAALFIENSMFEPQAYENGAYLLRDRFQNYCGIHPTYFSIFAICAASFLCFKPVYKNKGFRIITIISACFLFAVVILLAVRASIFILAAFAVAWIVFKKFPLLKKTLLIITSLLLLVILTFSIPSLNKRFGEITSWISGNTDYNNTLSQREIITSCSLKVFSKNILSGTGSKNFQQELNNCYRDKGWPICVERNYNPHNQFLSIGINYGIFFMLLFIACLYFIFRKVIHHPEARYYTIAIIIIFFSESFLERQMGVYFFGLFSLLFYNINMQKSILSINWTPSVFI